MKDIQKYFQSKKVYWTASIIVGLIIASLIFHAGVVFGTRRAFHAERFEHGFSHSFFPGNFRLPRGYIPGGHGAVGAITGITLPTITVNMRDGSVETILLNASTTILSANREGNTGALSVGRKVVVIGEPDAEGHIEAKIIRVIAASTQP